MAILYAQLLPVYESWLLFHRIMQHVLCTVVPVFLPPLLILINDILYMFRFCWEIWDGRIFENVPQL